MKIRKILSVLCAVAMFSAMLPTTFAAETPNISADSFETEYEPMEEPSDVNLVFDPARADIMEVDISRGAKPPKDMVNIDGEPYDVEGLFDTTIYTSYYFYPNANGELYYDFTFTWQETCATQRGACVKFIDMETQKCVLESPYDMSENSDGSYGPVIETGGRKVYNLNPTHRYYIHFTKSFDGVNATVTGTISSKSN